MAISSAAVFEVSSVDKRRFTMRIVFVALAAALSLTTYALAQEPVNEKAVQALRQMAIDAGQTTSSKAAPPTKSAEDIARAKARLESHRAAFFESAYSKKVN
jgi:hypothetical protein